MKKVFSISTFAIISSLMLTGCGTKQEPVKNETEKSSINIEADNINFKESRVKNTNVNEVEFKDQLISGLDNITIITENAKATNDEKIENLEKELEALNNINESEVSDKQLKEALALLKDGITKKIEFLAGTNEYHKGNKSDDYKEELVKIAYEATDSLLAAEIILK